MAHLARWPTGRVRRRAGQDRRNCMFVKLDRAEATPIPGTEGGSGAVLFARRRVDRILGRQHDQEGAGCRRSARHDLRRAARARLGRELGRGRHHLFATSTRHLQGVVERGNAGGDHTPTTDGRASSAAAFAARREGPPFYARDHSGPDREALGEGERRPALARYRRAARAHSRRRRCSLCQHGAPRVHEDGHVDGRALRPPIAAGDRRTAWR